MKDIAAVIIRVLGLVAAQWATVWVTNIGYDEGGGANIGAGLFAFLVLVVVSFGWAAFDARGSRRVGALVLRWVVVAVILGIAAAFQAQGFGTRSGLDMNVLMSDLMSLSAFIVGFVAVPAAAGLALGSSLTRRKRSPG